jgi:multiple sugar transport system permease protein/sn-glycerol 3-phosphate transport system permease protein
MSTVGRERLTFAAFVAPNLLLLAVFTYWPLLQNLYLSFVDWDMISPDKLWVGLDNWRLVLTDPKFWRIALNTVVFAAGTVGATLCLGLGAALLLNEGLRGRAGARTVLFSPVVLPGSAIALVWIYMFDPNWGLIRTLLRVVGVTSPAWLTDPAWALPAVIIVAVWKGLGYSTVIFLAGLQGIPRELYEAARVDGAGAWGRFWAVTLPGLGPVSFFLLVTSLLAAFQAFDVIRVMTNGGPVIATTTLVFALYQEGFTAFHAGRAAVYALVLFGAMLALTAAQLRYAERRVTYS